MKFLHSNSEPQRAQSSRKDRRVFNISLRYFAETFAIFAVKQKIGYYDNKKRRNP